METVDILVVGGGPAGTTAALRARELGAEVALIERAQLGGVAYNEGPAPVRTLARAARLARDAGAWERFGLRGDAPTVDFAAARSNARRVAEVTHARTRLRDFLRAAGVRLVEGVGPARFKDANVVGLDDGRRFEGRRIILAVGGHAGRLPIPGQELALTYSDLWTAERLPSRAVVIGASATGCQLASILEDFGCYVDLVESAPRIEPRSDEDVSNALAAAFVRRGMGVATGARVERLEKVPDGVRVRLLRSDGEDDFIDTDGVFFAVGWPGNTEELDLEAAHVDRQRAHIAVNERLQTSAPHVFAAGDVTGMSMLVQSAAYEGIVTAENAIFGPRRRYAYDVVPVGSFTDPEYASVGLTEAEARARHDCATAVVHYDELTRAVADGRTEGFCKLIADRGDGRVLGGHVVGEYSAEVIQLVAACMASGMSVARIAELQLAYPTFAQGVLIAAQRLARELGMILGVTPWGDPLDKRGAAEVGIAAHHVIARAAAR